MRYRILHISAVVLIGFILFQWPSYTPTMDGLSIGLLHYFIVIPLSILGLILSLGILISHRLKLKPHWLLAIYAILLTVSAISMSSRMLFEINGFLHPLEKRSLSQIQEEHYRYLGDLFSRPSPDLHFFKVECGILQTAQPDLLINPIQIFDASGNKITTSDLVIRKNQIGNIYLRLELPERNRFDALYKRTIPDDCLTENGGYMLPMTDEYDQLGVVPAIVHILPNPTASGSTVR